MLKRKISNGQEYHSNSVPTSPVKVKKLSVNLATIIGQIYLEQYDNAFSNLTLLYQQQKENLTPNEIEKICDLYRSLSREFRYRQMSNQLYQLSQFGQDFFKDKTISENFSKHDYFYKFESTHQVNITDLQEAVQSKSNITSYEENNKEINKKDIELATIAGLMTMERYDEAVTTLDDALKNNKDLHSKPHQKILLDLYIKHSELITSNKNNTSYKLMGVYEKFTSSSEKPTNHADFIEKYQKNANQLNWLSLLKHTEENDVLTAICFFEKVVNDHCNNNYRDYQIAKEYYIILSNQLIAQKENITQIDFDSSLNQLQITSKLLDGEKTDYYNEIFFHQESLLHQQKSETSSEIDCLLACTEYALKQLANSEDTHTTAKRIHEYIYKITKNLEKTDTKNKMELDDRFKMLIEKASDMYTYFGNIDTNMLTLNDWRFMDYKKINYSGWLDLRKQIIVEVQSFRTNQNPTPVEKYYFELNMQYLQQIIMDAMEQFYPAFYESLDATEFHQANPYFLYTLLNFVNHQLDIKTSASSATTVAITPNLSNSFSETSANTNNTTLGGSSSHDNAQNNNNVKTGCLITMTKEEALEALREMYAAGSPQIM